MNTSRTLLMLAVLALLMASAALAQDADTPPADDWQPASAAEVAPVPTSLSVLDLLGKLTIAVLVAWGLAHGARWLQRQNITRATLGAPAGESPLKLEQTLSLGVDGRLYLITVDDQRVLLAAREGSVQRIETDSETRPGATPIYRAATKRNNRPADELNIGHAGISTRPVRSDVIADSDNWAQRRDELLRELQDA